MRATILPGLVPTLRTGLGRVARVNLDHGNPSCLCFVGQERVELRKTPGMQAAFVAHMRVLFAASHLGGLTDVRQVLKDNGTARDGMLDDAFGEDMVMVFSLPKQLTRKLFQVPFGRFAPIGLELATETEDAMLLLFPSALPQELALAENSRAIQAQVNAYHLLAGSNDGRWKGHHDVQEIPAFAVTQISATDLATNILNRVLGNSKSHLNTACYSSKATGQQVPLDPVGALIIADTGILTVRAPNRLESRNGLAVFLGSLNLLGVGLFLLDLPRQRALDRLRGLDTSGTHQLRRQIGILRTQGIVRSFVQLYAIPTGRTKALLGYRIEAGRMLLPCASQDVRLLRRGVQLYDNRSIHGKNIS